MTIRPMEAHEDKRVRDIFALCHPDWPSRVSEWYVAYPTVVIGDPELVGFTSCSISPSATGLVTLYGNDLCVLPTRRRQGLGWALAEARLALGRAVGMVDRDDRWHTPSGLAHPLPVLAAWDAAS